MNGTVYSTEHGRHCAACGRPLQACICKKTAAPQGDGIVRISRETKGRKGKGVTVVRGLALDGDELKALAKSLRRRLSTGGSIKDFDLEFQGDHRQQLKALLEAEGYTVKLAGG